MMHALAAAKTVSGFTLNISKKAELKNLLQSSVDTKAWLTDNIFRSREKDYTNPFRMMMYNSPEEMDKVIGSLNDNQFIQQEKEVFSTYKKSVSKIVRKISA